MLISPSKSYFKNTILNIYSYWYKFRGYFNYFDNLTKRLQNNIKLQSLAVKEIFYVFRLLLILGILFFFHFSIVTTFCFPCTKAIFTFQVIRYLYIDVYLCIL